MLCFITLAEVQIKRSFCFCSTVGVALGALTFWHAVLISRGETSIERHINLKETKRLAKRGKVSMHKLWHITKSWKQTTFQNDSVSVFFFYFLNRFTETRSVMASCRTGKSSLVWRRVGASVCWGFVFTAPMHPFLPLTTSVCVFFSVTGWHESSSLRVTLHMGTVWLGTYCRLKRTWYVYDGQLSHSCGLQVPVMMDP